MSVDRQCNDCGNDTWEKFLEQENGTRVEERFACEECGSEGRKFTNGATVYAGAFR